MKLSIKTSKSVSFWSNNKHVWSFSFGGSVVGFFSPVYWKVLSPSILSRPSFSLENITEYFPLPLKKETTVISTWFQTQGKTKKKKCMHTYI